MIAAATARRSVLSAPGMAIIARVAEGSGTAAG
eukprot:CAMPEP_0183815994 /NCGR_PEP_ID=MMETSP0803_2-20130417/57873_1 /TAXON_ID=195967 /ORGANISM="Crustomastix stigmata, Strain CCMP3273" /LENGTH=32 /DNA_ID= /DNA_START= /DNA_END= /DNA_ORIENTATION=